MKTTLNEIKRHGPCREGWEKLLKSLNKTKADDEDLEIKHIIESNGIDDAIWCLRAVDGHDKEIRLFVVFCARQNQHLLTDERSINVINVAEKYANGEATLEELHVAWSAAWSALWSVARSVARSERSATYSAARLAAESAAESVRSVARSVAWSKASESQKKELLRLCANNE